LTIATRAMPCPGCGYDLRATAVESEGVRCPECGRVTPLAGMKGLTASRIPWVQRRWRGRVKGFVATAWWVIFQPWKLAREMEVTARMRDARRFELICRILATVVGCAFMEGLSAVGREASLPPGWENPALAPAFVLLEYSFGVLPLGLGVFVATWACAGLYRQILTLGGGTGWRGEPRYEARRLQGLSHYSAALWLVMIGFLGGGGASGMWWVIEGEKRRGDVTVPSLLVAGTVVAAVIVYAVASFGLALRTGRWRRLRLALLAGYLVVGPALWVAVVVAVNWAVGYVVLGVLSMMT
jgi:hypothetical protein